MCQKLAREDQLCGGVRAHLPLPMSDHVLSAEFGKHSKVSPCGLNLLGGVLDGRRLGCVLLLRLHSECDLQALSFGLLIQEQSSLDEECGKGSGSGGLRCRGWVVSFHLQPPSLSLKLTLKPFLEEQFMETNHLEYWGWGCHCDYPLTLLG